MKSIHRLPLEEKKRHGDILFPFNIYPCTIPGDFPSVALHWHRNMEVIFVKKGRMYAQIGMQSAEVSRGDICILPPGALHGLRAMEGERAEYENIIFDPELLGSGAADICAMQYLVPLAAGQLLQSMLLRPGEAGYEAVSASLVRAEQLSEARPAGFEMGVKAELLGLVFQLMQMQLQQPNPELPGTARLKKALGYIQSEYARPITVEEMANVCGCSASHFMRWFRSMTGERFVSYLNEYRLAEAAQRLRGSEEKILTIAQDVGFESLSNFNHQFKLRYNMTPREYRQGGKNN